MSAPDRSASASPDPASQPRVGQPRVGQHGSGQRRSGAHGRRQGGPPPLVPALVYGALLIAAVALLAGAPHPGTPAASALTWDRAHTGVLHAAALVIFGAAAPLAIWTATIYRRLRTLGVTAPGAVIGLSGGLLASASLALSGLVIWTLAETAPSVSPALAQVLMDLSFAAGAAGFVVPLALLLAGVAVPSLILRLTPRAGRLGRPGRRRGWRGVHVHPGHPGPGRHPAHRPVRRPGLDHRGQPAAPGEPPPDPAARRPRAAA